ncbi:hypothetical protein J6590_031998 [Homalodisca vitripennis]|nr:hypothetical protein J6590_031998 [Homalodisca vitripennis]
MILFSSATFVFSAVLKEKWWNKQLFKKTWKVPRLWKLVPVSMVICSCGKTVGHVTAEALQGQSKEKPCDWYF